MIDGSNSYNLENLNLTWLDTTTFPNPGSEGSTPPNLTITKNIVIFQDNAPAPPALGTHIPPKPAPNSTHPDRSFLFGDGKYGVFRWDEKKNAYVLIGTKGSPNGPVTELDLAKFNEYNANVGVKAPTVPEAHPSWEDDLIVIDADGDGPIWRLAEDGNMVHVGNRVNGENVYFDRSTYSSVKAYNDANGVAYEPEGTSTEVPQQPDSEHPDIWVPPDGVDSTLFRYDPKVKAYMKAGTVKAQQIALSPLSTYVADNKGRSHNPAPIPERHPDYKDDWIDSDASGDGPIYRMTKAGKVIQIGVRKAGEDTYFSKETVNLLAANNPKGGPTPPLEDIAMLNATQIKQLTGLPPTEGSSEYPDKEIKLPDGKIGVMRWEANVERYVLVGTRETSNGTIDYLPPEQYREFNNGPVPAYSHKDTPEASDYDDPATGTIWRWDPKLGREVQVGTMDYSKNPPVATYFSEEENTGPTAFENDITQSVIDKYNKSKGKIPDGVGRERATMWQWPRYNNVDFPDVWAADTNGQFYLWRYHPDLKRYVAINDADNTEYKDYKWYIETNKVPGGVSKDPSSSGDYSHIPAPKQDGYDDREYKDADGIIWLQRYVPDWVGTVDNGRWMYIAKKDSPDKPWTYLTKSEYEEQNSP
ncbi:hypothetical protein [Noviherbaspirillum saxi]|uniref:Uncharacterized protein n=1 Tax=Noviherbaspirillum saxi TaxID=2320863 RepID=A0A3A3FFN8_9BURK|nr:hypothetical protein [Noviherbaspirillum saxi]RJF92151.1 hypothetical protein D3871_26270 [Noviherbaspirillum saxi]